MRTSVLIERNHCDTQKELMIRFALWAHGLREIPTAARIRERFGVSVATAYRWRNAWCTANGLPIPESRWHPSPHPREPISQPGGNRSGNTLFPSRKTLT